MTSEVLHREAKVRVFRNRTIRWLITGLVFLLLAAPAVAGWRDLTGHWAESGIAALQAKGIVTGVDPDTFLPDDPLTRAQFAKMLVVALGMDRDAGALKGWPTRFSDVPSSYWGAPHIEAAAEAGIIQGYGDGRFGPDDQITRVQLTAMMIRAAGLADRIQGAANSVLGFSDASGIPEWARGLVALAVREGLISGFDDGTFRPDAPATRAEGGVMVVRLLSRLGNLYSRAGTIWSWDPDSSVLVLEGLGDEPITMAPEAQYYRNGRAVPPQAISRYDQAVVILDRYGRGTFVEARLIDAVATNLDVKSGSQTLNFTSRGSSTPSTVRVAETAIIFLNGQPTRLSDVRGATRAYVVYDAFSGEIRALDAARFTHRGTVTRTDPDRRTVTVIPEGAPERNWQLSASARVFLNGGSVQIGQLQTGDKIEFVAAGQEITYLEALR